MSKTEKPTPTPTAIAAATRHERPRVHVEVGAPKLARRSIALALWTTSPPVGSAPRESLRL